MKNLAADNNGTTAIEYALIASLISIVIVTATTVVGTKLSTMFGKLNWKP